MSTVDNAIWNKHVTFNANVTMNNLTVKNLVIENQVAGTYDVIVVGAEGSGAVFANKVSEDPNTSVLVLEWGKES
jgi:hypothetical protein